MGDTKLQAIENTLNNALEEYKSNPNSKEVLADLDNKVEEILRHYHFSHEILDTENAVYYILAFNGSPKTNLRVVKFPKWEKYSPQDLEKYR